MSKRYFQVTISGYGAEVKIGRVTEEFAEYWQDKANNEGIGLFDYWNGDADESDIPEEMIPLDDWFSYDDCCSTYSPYVDNGYDVYELNPHPDTEFKDGDFIWKKGKEVPRDSENPFKDTRFEYVDSNPLRIDGSYVTNREAYMSDEKEEYYPDRCVAFKAMEKGDWGHLFIELDISEEFNPLLFQYTVLETDMGEFAENFFYDRKPLIHHAGSPDQKSMDCWFGYIDFEGSCQSHDHYSIYQHDENGNEHPRLKMAFDEWYAENEGALNE